MLSFVGVRRRAVAFFRLVPEAVMSLNACLDAPILDPRPSEDLGVKKRVNLFGVTVGDCLRLVERVVGSMGGDDVRFSFCVESAIV